VGCEFSLSLSLFLSLFMRKSPKKVGRGATEAPELSFNGNKPFLLKCGESSKSHPNLSIYLSNYRQEISLS